MVSQVAWIDASVDDQRGMREILKLFSQQESRDELGIGQIRDALSDELFPGISVLHTRPRYLLLVPWCFLTAENRSTHRTFDGEVERVERNLISTLRNSDDHEGMIGARAGTGVRILPSAIYWTALQAFGIFTGASRADADPGARSDIGAQLDDDNGPVLANPWNTLPVPQGFPSQLDRGLSLTRDEADYLRIHVLTAVPDSLLSHLLREGSSLVPTDFPWDEPTSHHGDERLIKSIELARRFSLLMHGAALLYNLLVGERYEKRYGADSGLADRYRERLAGWVETARSDPHIASWDLTELWTLVRRHNPRVSLLTKSFVMEWHEASIRHSTDLAGDPAARRLVADRERRLKRRQSRLDNDKLLATWQGASGAGQLSFRWSQVRRMVNDITDGLRSADA